MSATERDHYTAMPGESVEITFRRALHNRTASALSLDAEWDLTEGPVTITVTGRLTPAEVVRRFESARRTHYSQRGVADPVNEPTTYRWRQFDEARVAMLMGQDRRRPLTVVAALPGETPLGVPIYDHDTVDDVMGRYHDLRRRVDEEEADHRGEAPWDQEPRLTVGPGLLSHPDAEELAAVREACAQAAEKVAAGHALLTAALARHRADLEAQTERERVVLRADQAEQYREAKVRSDRTLDALTSAYRERQANRADTLRAMVRDGASVVELGEKAADLFHWWPEDPTPDPAPGAVKGAQVVAGNLHISPAGMCSVADHWPELPAWCRVLVDWAEAESADPDGDVPFPLSPDAELPSAVRVLLACASDYDVQHESVRGAGWRGEHGEDDGVPPTVEPLPWDVTGTPVYIHPDSTPDAERWCWWDAPTRAWRRQADHRRVCLDDHGTWSGGKPPAATHHDVVDGLALDQMESGGVPLSDPSFDSEFPGTGRNVRPWTWARTRLRNINADADLVARSEARQANREALGLTATDDLRGVVTTPPLTSEQIAAVRRTFGPGMRVEQSSGWGAHLPGPLAHMTLDQDGTVSVLHHTAPAPRRPSWWRRAAARVGLYDQRVADYRRWVENHPNRRDSRLGVEATKGGAES